MFNTLFRRRPWLWGLPVAVVALALWATLRQPSPVAPTPPAAAKPALAVRLTQARTTALPLRLQANGNVAAWQELIVSAEVAGLRLQDLLPQVGDTVQRGQLLATFDAEGVRADVALARAALAEARANQAEATANAQRARAVQGSGAQSAQQIDQYLTQELAAQARVASAQAQLDAQLLRLAHTEVRSPDAGTVWARSASVGAVLPAGSELLRLIRQDRLEWRAELTAAELARVRPGLTVWVQGPAGEPMKGRVRRVAPTVDAQTRNGLVYVDLLAPATAAALKPGMFVKGSIELGQSAAQVLPSSAVLVREGYSYVMRVDAQQRVSPRKVQTGRSVGDLVEILAGLQPGESVVASGAAFLGAGDLVRIAPDSEQNQPIALENKAQAATQ